MEAIMGELSPADRPRVRRPTPKAVVSGDETYYRGVAEMLDVMPERVVRYHVDDLMVTYCNAAWAAGHQLTPAEVIGHSIAELLSPGEREGLEFQLARLTPENPVLADDVARPAPNAPGQWVEWVDRYLPGPDGAEIIAVGRDVTGRHIAELNLAASEARFRTLADKSADVVWRFVTEPYPHFDYMSPSVENIIGYPPSVFLEDFTQFLAILDDEGRALVTSALRGDPMPERFDLRYRHKNGSTIIGEMQTTLIRAGLQGVSRDVTELRTLQEKLSALALRDPLTGLANRRLFKELLEADLARTKRNGQPLAVAFLDLDDFKAINDTYGHDAGDIVLCETARRLLAMVRGADAVARIGGDEFVIAYEPSDVSSDHLIERLDTALAAPIDIGGGIAVPCHASIGHADTNTVGPDAAALMAAADADMYVVKRARQGARAVVKPAVNAA
jgi:diguanylate cyclase (GGDEF)-like protein/PAS domain S-box-containing protein